MVVMMGGNPMLKYQPQISHGHPPHLASQLRRYLGAFGIQQIRSPPAFPPQEKLMQNVIIYELNWALAPRFAMWIRALPEPLSALRAPDRRVPMKSVKLGGNRRTSLIEGESPSKSRRICTPGSYARRLAALPTSRNGPISLHLINAQ